MKEARTNKVASSKHKRVLLVEDHPLTREGLARWINCEPDLKVCGEAESASQAISLAERLKPDFVVTDLSLPAGNGLELIKDLKARYPGLPVLVLSMHDELAYAGRVLRAGARGYVMKRAGGEGVVKAIRDILAGGLAFSPAMVARLLGGAGDKQSPSGRRELANLTDREFEVLQLLGEAKGNAEIARQLHISIKTVQTHRMNLSHKLAFKRPSELMRFAIQYAGSTAGYPEV